MLTSVHTQQISEIEAVVADGATTAPFLLFLLQNRTGARPHAENKKSKKRCLDFLLLSQPSCFIVMAPKENQFLTIYVGKVAC